MTEISLSQQDKEELLEYLVKYEKNIDKYEVGEVKNKLDKKVSQLRKKKNLPSYIGKMISQINYLTEALELKDLSEEKRKKVVAAFHYFIMAEDRIPDYIPIVGYLDDAFIIRAFLSGSPIFLFMHRVIIAAGFGRSLPIFVVLEKLSIRMRRMTNLAMMFIRFWSIANRKTFALLLPIIFVISNCL